jgi:cytochrome c-type biogenesis protein CcmH/NrfG
METLKDEQKEILQKIDNRVVQKKSKTSWILGLCLLALILIVLYLNGMGIYTQDSWYR